MAHFRTTSQPDPLFLATAVEAVLRAGELQMDKFGRRSASTRRATSTWSRRSTSRSSRCSARSSPSASPSTRSRRGAERRRSGARRLARVGVRSDRRHDQLRARPADLLRVARAGDRRRAGRRRRCTTRRVASCSRRSAASARSSTARRLQVSSARRSWSTRCSSPAFPTTSTSGSRRLSGLFGRFVGRARAVRRLGSAAIDLCYVAAGRMDGFWEQQLKPWDMAAGALIVREAGGRVTGMDGGAYSSRTAHLVATNDHLHETVLATIREFAAERSRNRTI